jgi:uncharacterized protein (DUF433 family)
MADTTTTTEEKLIARYIEPDRHRPSADQARIKGYGMNVWALIGALGTENGDVAGVARAYAVPDEVVQAALAYYRRHKTCIDVLIRANSGGRVELGDDPLILKHIALDPDWDSEADARIKGYGMNVWALIGEYKAIGGDIEEVATAYRVPVEVVQAALAYYHEHKDAIDCRLAANMA